MTNVIVQHLTLENKKVMIPCKDHVNKIAVYKDRLYHRYRYTHIFIYIIYIYIHVYI